MAMIRPFGRGAWWDCGLVLCLCTLFVSSGEGLPFKFASVYGDHMVLQQAPHRAVVWGQGDPGSNVTVRITPGDSEFKTVNSDAGLWNVTLDPMKAGGPYNITAIQHFKGVTPLEAIRKLFDVMFGDVWVCSGQSNMQFTVMMGFNSTEEILAANNYPNIRLFTAGLVGSDTPLSNLDRVEQPWSVASAASVGGGMWNYFSALCWFYGRDLYDTLQYPIGLVASSFEGTPIEYWSSPDVLKKCNVNDTLPKKDKPSTDHPKHIPIVSGDNQNSVLWNAMIHPILNMTIKGAIWYQGESNADHPDSYLCLFPAMIDSWRSSWYLGTGGQTDPTFPFGFMQISGNVPGSTNLGYPEIRWHQTADYGYVPNPKMEKVFMAVAMDLWRPDSPWLTVHPQDKQDMGTRLSLAARAVAYGDKNIKFQGPFPSSLELGSSTVVVLYGPEAGHIEVRSTGGFEVCCSSVKNTCDEATAAWVEAPMVHTIHPNATNSVTVSTDNCHKIVTAVRYAWRETPCGFKMCPVYGMGSMQVPLPAPPFIMYMRVPQG
ncbi:SIAE [Branchiostoma lanceolatum]|uniref:SIAE protein n=1 Tax=Branchiostoma lanceolatum TaxID=7740 RepID=A0A8K0F056_BRALA|nr:SIAE [Branchiostoma lanceolatum]